MSVIPALDAAEPSRGDTDVSTVAALMGDPARARILLALCAADAMSAAALAREARLSAPATSAHLGKLLAVGLVTVTRAGRHRYYRIGGREVVSALESLARLAPTRPVRSLHEDRRSRELHFARICFDHLAGDLAVRVAESMIERGAVLAAPPDAVGDVTWSTGDRAREVFAELGVASADVTLGPLYPCLDWSVRRPHLSGALGAALLTAMLAAGWIERHAGHRAVSLTAGGRSALRGTLGIETTTG